MRYPVEDLKKFVVAVMTTAGLEEEESKIFADGLLFADLRGIGSHGISRLRTYAKRVECGVVSSNITPEIIMDSGALLAVDGKNGIGVSVALQVMDICIERAKQYGCSFVGVKNGTHFGTGAYLTKYAANKNMIGFAISNSEAAVVPIGGAKPMLGTNPLSVSIPAGKHNPLVLDMATSVVARGKVVLAEKEGKTIPDSWCVDANGAPTTDPKAALEGAMLPFGGAKGYAISLIIDLMCSSLAGALDGRKTHRFWDDFENPQNVGYFIGAFDISKIRSVNEFTDSVDSIFNEFKACPTAPGVEEVMIPGEIEDRKEQDNIQNGIILSESVIDDLINVADHYSVKHPFIQ
ncbi:Ldh family oxidoreductase [Aeribacillus sp. FSL M8-0235]|uniref:Ldh family oxidoreductase n=1 Tax=Aeribacillus sp. FSL M8-0235 TaxID=2954576 RepID=UPI0030F96BC6